MLFRSSFALILALFLVGSQSPVFTSNANAKAVTEWTFLVFLNGNNNLDSFGDYNINQMESVGSNDKVNLIVQWASLKNRDVRRILIKKDNNLKKVTSPVVENLGTVDMGDWHSLVDFVSWGAKNYPAKHYFVDVWDHGAGWHKKMMKEKAGDQGMSPVDISWDDISGNHMTTQQLGLALQESAKIIGHKVDIYGSDACLMAMPEVAAEMADSVEIFVGSEETEPADGWAYDGFVQRWLARPRMNPTQVAQILVEEYVKYYEKKHQSVTLSAFDLTRFEGFNQAVKNLGSKIQAMSSTELKKVLSAANASQSFAYSDYVDFIDFLDHMKEKGVTGLDAELTAAEAATRDFVVAEGSHDFKDTHGLSLWIPTSSWTLKSYADRYSQLMFDHQTHWLDALKAFLK